MNARDREPTPSDAEIERESKRLALEKSRVDVRRMDDELETARRNRKLRGRVAIGALLVMLLQILVANAIFAWYGDTNGWDVSPAAISAWLTATVVQVVSVVLVITNYLFPKSPATA
ncbi:MAG TPA: hypothetical protein VNB64_09420 [Solirubrobacteraceae bacterium]|nr:hypothetical protein [Solirubrobacteraceae bacterium]